jgi:hypothetical protein
VGTRRRGPRRRVLLLLILPESLVTLLPGAVIAGEPRLRPSEADAAILRPGREPMRVSIELPATGLGYFPGLARPVVIEPGALSEPEARKAAELVAAARFFDRPASAAAESMARGLPDARQYTITIEQGGRRHTLRIAEPIDDPGLRELVRFLEVKAKAVRAKARTGAPPDRPG